MTLDENDYLIYQLYTASKSPRIKKARMKSWALTTIAFVSLAYLFYRSDNAFLAVYFLIAAGLCIILFPFYSRWRYKKHYLKYITDTFKAKIGVECAVMISNDEIITKDKTGEVRINTSEVEEVNEISDHYFLKIKSGESLIISKSKTQDFEDVKKAIQSLIVSKQIKHNIELDWKWQ